MYVYQKHMLANMFFKLNDPPSKLENGKQYENKVWHRDMLLFIFKDLKNINPIPHGGGGGGRFCPLSDCLLYNFRSGCSRTTKFGDFS